MATVRELVVALGLDFESSGFAKADAAIKVLKSGFIGVGAVVAGAAAAVTGITVAMAKQADQLNDSAAALGISTEAMQKLGYAAQLSGSNAEEMHMALTHLTATANAAAEGSQEMAKNFASAGLSLHDQNGKLKTADQLLLDLADGMQKVENPTKRAALAAQVLGRNAGPKLVQMLSQGSEGIKALGQELEDLGGLIDEDFIQASAQFNDQLDRMNVVIKSVGLSVAKAFLPHVKGAIDSVIRWYRANRLIVDERVQFFVSRLASAFSAIADGVGYVVNAFSRFFDGSSTMTRVLSILAGAAIAVGLAFLLPAAPVIILGALILALLDDIHTFSTGGKSLIGDVVKEWENFKSIMEETQQTSNGLAGTLASLARSIIAIGGAVSSLFTFDPDKIKDAFGELTDVAFNDFDALKHRRKRKENLEAFKVLADSGLPDAQLSASPLSVETVAKIRRNGITTDHPIDPNSPLAGDTNTTTINAPITVNAAPGQSTEDVGEAVKKKIEELRQNELSAARAALVPAGAK